MPPNRWNMTIFNQAQYDDLVVKSKDVYAHTK